MPNFSNYVDERDEINILKARELTNQLPAFTKSFFIAKSDLVPSSQLAYAVDLTIFFEWLKAAKSEYKECSTRNLPIEILESVTSDDLEQFIKEYLTRYERNGKIYRNGYAGKARKLAAVKDLFNHYSTHKDIPNNPAIVVTLKAPQDHQVLYLQPNEMADLLDCVDDGYAHKECEKNNKSRAAAWHHVNRIRDLAILTTLLGTGIRVSELVGMDVTDVDFDEAAISIIRKGHKRDTVYMNEEVEETIRDYIDNARSKYGPSEDETALFLSLKHNRLSVRSVEVLVKKYVAVALPLRAKQKISPHKMRSSFATNLYNDKEIGGDIKLVADAIGHKNLQNTAKYYTDTNDAVLRKAFRGTKLREKES